MKDNKIKSEEKLAHRVLKSLSIRVSLIVLVSSVISYLHLYHTIEEGTINTLEEYISEKTQRESFVFEQAHKNHDHLKSLISNFLAQDEQQAAKAKEFSTHFEKKEDQTYRNKKDYDGTSMAGLFLPPDYPLNKRKRSLIVYLKELAETLGPAYRSNFQDTYFTTPENAMIIYWPEVPNWTVEMKPDFNMTKEEYVWIADREHNPERKTVWTGLFYDKVGKVWMTSAETPIYYKNKHILTIGHDLMLSELLLRAQKETLPGAYNVIFRKDGRLILHPNKIAELKKTGGYYDIHKSDNSFLKGIVSSILQSPQGNNVIEHSTGNDLLAFGKIEGPDWFFVTVYPKSLITSTALKGILFVIVLAFLSLVIEVFMLWIVIRKEISEPIEELFAATIKMTEGNLQAAIDVKRKDELGVFAKTFNSMSEAIVKRDQKLQEYAHSLERKVAERTLELDKQRAQAIETAKLASLGEMAGGIAHEINNPLTVIAGSMTLIEKHISKDPVDVEKIENLSQKVTETVTRIESIINGLKTYARTGHQDDFKYEPLDAIIKETLALCEHKLKMSNIKLTYQPNEEISLECQRVQLSQVLINLISNSADEISKQKTKKWITISIEEDHDLVRIRVEDSGHGISLDVQEKMFQPFFTTKDVGQGTGIGLSISSGIVKSHNGRLYVDNDSKNTCLVIELPKQQKMAQQASSS